jgi:chromate transport protein ChrA
MQSDAVGTYHWMTHGQFLNAVALGQVTPGPLTPARASGPSRSRSRSLTVMAAVQALVFALGGSLALLADLIHNGGDALTAIPLGIAFALRSPRA